MAMIRVLVCGGRKYSDIGAVHRSLDAVHRRTPIDAVIDGGALGADAIARAWAWDEEIETVTFVADWEKDGRAAGPIRNRRMLDEGKPDLVLAFPGGRGTANMMALARKAGVEVRQIQPLTPRSSPTHSS